MGKAYFLDFQINDAHPNLLLELAVIFSRIDDLPIVELRVHPQLSLKLRIFQLRTPAYTKLHYLLPNQSLNIGQTGRGTGDLRRSRLGLILIDVLSPYNLTGGWIDSNLKDQERCNHLIPKGQNK
jgi:hypothetical protein